MKNIVYILPYLANGGTETHVLELIKGFKEKYSITLLAPCGPRLKQFKEEGISILPFTRLDQNFFKGIKEFKKQVIKLSDKTDLFHIHAAHELILLTKIFLKNKRIPLMFTSHGYPNLLNYKLLSFFGNRWANCIISVAKNETRKMLGAGLNRNKINLIYNGIELPENYSAKNLPIELQNLKENNKIIIGTVARLEKDKGIHILLESFKKIKHHKNAHLLIIGSGSLEEKLKNDVKNSGMEDMVSFTGFVSNIHDYYEIMDIFVLPSFKEAFGLVCTEAMAHKLPVITTNCGGTNEQVINDETGIIVPVNDSKKLTEALYYLLNNISLAKKMGEAGFQRYKNNFTIEIMLDKLDKLYNKFL